MKNKGSRRKCNFLDYDEAASFVLLLGLKSHNDWREYTKSASFPAFLPKKPCGAYMKAGWKGYPAFLGYEVNKPLTRSQIINELELIKSDGFSYSKFREEKSKLYHLCSHLGLLPEAKKIFGVTQGYGFWSKKQNCKKAALELKTKNEYHKKYPQAVRQAKKNGWYDEITSHMISTNLIPRSKSLKQQEIRERDSNLISRAKLEKRLNHEGFRIVEKIPEAFMQKDFSKISVACLKCGNTKNRLGNGNLNFSYHRTVRCPICSPTQNTILPPSKYPDLVKKALKSKQLMLNCNVDWKKLRAGTPLHLKCRKCGNTKARDGRKEFCLSATKLVNTNVGCSRCKGIQTYSKEELNTLLKDLKLQSFNPSSKVKTRQVFKCKICNVEFKSDLDTIKNGNHRGCNCSKNSWKIFENKIKEVFGTDTFKLEKLRPDLTRLDSKTIVECKFGESSLSSQRDAKRIGSQLLKYNELASEGWRVVYLVCVESSLEKYQRSFPDIEFYNLSELSKFILNGKRLSKEDIRFINDLYKDPFSFNNNKRSYFYDYVAKTYLDLVILNENVLVPGHMLKILKTDFDLNSVKRAFNVSNLKELKVEIYKILSEEVLQASERVKLKNREVAFKKFKSNREASEKYAYKRVVVKKINGRIKSFVVVECKKCGISDDKKNLIRLSHLTETNRKFKNVCHNGCHR